MRDPVYDDEGVRALQGAEPEGYFSFASDRQRVALSVVEALGGGASCDRGRQRVTREEGQLRTRVDKRGKSSACETEQDFAFRPYGPDKCSALVERQDEDLICAVIRTGAESCIARVARPH